jgi:hypothetical protein
VRNPVDETGVFSHGRFQQTFFLLRQRFLR